MGKMLKFKIADTVIKMESDSGHEETTEEERRVFRSERYDNFSYFGKEKPEISIKVNVVKKLPRVSGIKHIFSTFHFQNGSANWHLFRKGNAYVYKTPLEDKLQLMLVNKAFDRVTAFVLPKKNKGWVWSSADIIYDFLQVLLINHFALKNKGIFTHSIGIKDLDGSGLLFNGKSGAGKSTTARIWYKHSKAMVLNDDRIIVRKIKGKFLIYGSPWHGEFSDYLDSHIESAPPKKIFFIHHAKANNARKISPKEAFSLFYPALFPTFWDKTCLENVVSFATDLIKNVPCYRLGFVNNKKVIDFVRRI